MHFYPCDYIVSTFVENVLDEFIFAVLCICAYQVNEMDSNSLNTTATSRLCKFCDH
jgi:hypothetical protein